MKINILSPGRFHVLDLARELDKLGHDVRFYSFVPGRRFKKFGFDSKKNSNCLLLLAPIFVLLKLRLIKSRKVVNGVQDWVTSKIMRKCDVVIAMSGCFCRTIDKAKKDGAIIIVERGSKHILEQKRILESITSNKIIVPQKNIDDELHDYHEADYISIAAKHVKKSFIERGFDSNRLFVNPYGVELKDFKPMDIPKQYDVIMTGNWCMQKGCDILAKACSNLNLKLLHVGVVSNDCKLPDDVNFTHVDKVDQKELCKYYNMAKVFGLASRQEGMALVQMQAIACGLPIVCSPNTGGVDIGNVAPVADRIFEMRNMSVEALEEALRQALQFAEHHNYNVPDLSGLSWSSYGKRYDTFLSAVIKNG